MISKIDENKYKDAKIQFGSDFHPLTYYDEEYWELMERHLVEFYPNKWYDVILLSTETPNFLDYLSECGDSPISLDLEWESELCLFQFCFNNKVVILRHPNGEGNKNLLNFLLTHKFYAKGINNDKKQLHKKFNTTEIADNIEDIARTRLIPYNYSENFMAMVRQFSGEPTAEFKDIRITMSNWELPKLSKRQILYAAFDVVSLKECYPNYPPPKEIVKNKINNQDSNNDSDEDNNNNNNKVKKPKRIRSSLIASEEFQPREIRRAFSSPPSNPNKTSNNSSPSTILEKSTRNVKLKRSPAREITGFIVKGYKGPKNIYTIKKIFSFGKQIAPKSGKKTTENQTEESFLHDDISNIDFCSTFEDNLFIGFYEIENEQKVTEKLQNYGESVTKIESSFTINNLHISAEESTDGDVLFVQNISNGLIEKFNTLLYCFGANHEFKYTKDDDLSLDYIRIEPHEASSSYRLKLFLSKFEFEGKTPIISEFPYFLPIIRVNNIPSNFNEESLRNLFKEAGKIRKVEILRRRIDQDKQTAFVTFQTTEEADKAVQLFNHLRIDSESDSEITSKNNYQSNIDLFLDSNLSSIELLNNELKVFRFSDEPHLRFMRRFEIRDTRIELFNSNSKDLEKHYSKYGRIHLCFFDPFFNVGRVQFYDKKDAMIASKSEICEMTEESKTIVIRDLPFETTDSEILDLCSQFGTIVNLITRDINEKMRFIIKEVSFASNEDANKAKVYFSSIKTIHGAAIRVAVLNGGFSAAPDWKMRQRKHWVRFVGQKPDDEFYEKTTQNGNIVKIEYKIAETKVVVPLQVNSTTTTTSSSSNEKENDNEKAKKCNENDDEDDLQTTAITPVTVTKPQEFTYVMFQDFESTKAYNETCYPTIDEFVDFLNPTELYVEKQIFRVECPNEQINTKAPFGERKPVQMAILIDPIPFFVTKEMLVDYLGEFSEHCDVFISSSMQAQNSKINNNNNNHNDDDDDNEDINDEDDDESEDDDDVVNADELKRAVLVPMSRTLTNKIYSMMNDRPIEDSENSELLKPVRMRFENVPNQPKIKPKEKVVVRQESKKMTIVVDPIPDQMTNDDIEKICSSYGKYTLTFTGSGKIEGKRRALIHPLSCRAKKHIFKALSIDFGNEKIVPFRIFPKDIPPPIDSSQASSDSTSDSASTSKSV